MTKFEALETPRLIIRRFRDDDLVPLLTYRNDPKVSEYQMWQHYKEQRAKDLIEQSKKEEPGETGYFQFALELKETRELIGDFMLKTESDKRLAEIGYTLAYTFQGKGLAREAAKSVIEYAFKTLNMHRLSATADPRNVASLKLLERLGFRKEAHFVKNLWFKGEWADDVVYAILNEEWQVSKE